jgi:competence protein ComEC
LGHHGSKTSTSIELLELFKPAVSIVSAGLKNRYGHPHKSVIDRIQSNIPDSQICSTASGTISVRIKQKESF